MSVPVPRTQIKLGEEVKEASVPKRIAFSAKVIKQGDRFIIRFPRPLRNYAEKIYETKTQVMVIVEPSIIP